MSYSLYCSEGKQQVTRPTVRVRQNPGGDQTFNFMTGEAVKPHGYVEPKPLETIKAEPKPQPQQKQSFKITESAPKAADPEPAQTKKVQSNNNEYSALYCSEGKTLVSRPSVKIIGHKSTMKDVLGWG